LFAALAPGLLLGSLLFAVLTLVHFTLGESKATAPTLYLLTMTVTGVVTYAVAFMLIPIPALRTEAARWRGLLWSLGKFISKP
jgi:hypothetical protein